MPMGNPDDYIESVNIPKINKINNKQPVMINLERVKLPEIKSETKNNGFIPGLNEIVTITKD